MTKGIVWTVIGMMIAICFLACSGAGSSSSDGSSTQTYTPYNLFPTKLNSTWTYDNGKTVKVTSYSESNGKANVYISNIDGSGTVALVLSNSEVQYSWYSSPDYIMVAETYAQNPLIKVPLTQGTSWTYSETSNGYPIDMTATVTSTTASVTIGSTTYNNCTEVNVDMSYPSGFYLPPWRTNLKFYFVPDVGCIKRIDTWSDSTVTSISLTSYNIP